MTSISAAVCADGIASTADKKFTFMDGRTPECSNKLFGDLRHVIIGYCGGRDTFDFVRNYLVGDLVILRDSEKKYTLDNLINRIAEHVDRFNSLIAELESESYMIQLLIGLNEKRELWWIDKSGQAALVKYKTIGSGEQVADKFLANLPLDSVSMEKFAEQACLSIKFMEKNNPELGVGTCGSDPEIWYLPDGADDRHASTTELEKIREYVTSEL